MLETNTTIYTSIPSPSPSSYLSTTPQDPPSLTLIFGILGTLIAAIGLIIATLQLRHMYQRRRKAVRHHAGIEDPRTVSLPIQSLHALGRFDSGGIDTGITITPTPQPQYANLVA
ncbi:hypothetical protein P280DRAFT_319423 [Massarina eburnea CBS 473.64]|uniref:Uncharacterized protein n=1 Tax=Massarina eburnea CBS 473.64 TaxID=1395130 RepID=A0A6A6RY39_9PLEO|nr:hypothetical protein P280DRAFT_319423 [Massarina eburnea CBS 473.64]